MNSWCWGCLLSAAHLTEKPLVLLFPQPLPNKPSLHPQREEAGTQGDPFGGLGALTLAFTPVLGTRGLPSPRPRPLGGRAEVWLPLGPLFTHLTDGQESPTHTAGLLPGAVTPGLSPRPTRCPRDTALSPGPRCSPRTAPSWSRWGAWGCGRWRGCGRWQCRCSALSPAG